MSSILFATPWTWWVAGLVLIALEIILPGVYLLWLGLGAALVGVALWALPDLSYAGQWLVFAFSLLLAVGIGFWAQRHTHRQPADRYLNQNLQSLVGRRYEAATDFTRGQGRLRVGDTTYAAVSDDAIVTGATVEVVGVSQGRLKVRGLDPSASSPDT